MPVGEFPKKSIPITPKKWYTIELRKVCGKRSLNIHM